MLITTNAIVLSAIKYSEADLIVTCFTEKKGRKSYMLRGVLKSKKGKIRASYFQPLTQLEMEANHKDKESLDYLKEVKISFSYQTIHTTIHKASLVLFLSEVLKNTIQEEESNPPLYQYLVYAFQWLDGATVYGNFHIIFLLELSRYLGFYPDDSAKQHPYFNLLEGCFQEEVANIYCEKGTSVEALKKFLGIKFDAVTAIKLSKNERAEALNLLLLYYQLHLQGFKKPKSLDVLQQLFN